jgi:hypothetical protein
MAEQHKFYRRSHERDEMIVLALAALLRLSVN